MSGAKDKHGHGRALEHQDSQTEQIGAHKTSEAHAIARTYSKTKEGVKAAYQSQKSQKQDAFYKDLLGDHVAHGCSSLANAHGGHGHHDESDGGSHGRAGSLSSLNNARKMTR